MAKKKKTKKAEDKPAKLNKAEIRAFFKENGWKETISHFGIAPKDLSPIVKGKKAKEAAKEAAPKKKKKKASAEAAPKAPKKKKKNGKGKKVAKSADAPYGFKKDGTPRKPPGRKAGKKVSKKADKAEVAPKAPKKNGGRPKGKKAADGSSTTSDTVLDWLLSYRAKNQKAGHMLPLDSVIIDLTTKIRR